MVNSSNLLTNLKRNSIVFYLLCAVALSSISQPAHAQINDFKIIASDGAAGDEFGKSVSISGDYAVVGAAWDDDNGTDAGSAYIFKLTGESWVQEAKLLASDGAAGEKFGWSVSISGDYAVVGAYRDDDNGTGSGSAYIFKLTGESWVQEAKLLPSDGTAADEFGFSVSISGDYAVVGAHLDDDNGMSSGSAYVFKRSGTTWAQETKLLPSDGFWFDGFGISVSISGDYAVVGAQGNSDNGDQSGSAYVFKRTATSWAQEAKLLASDGATGDKFGVSVSISGDYALMGAVCDGDNGSCSGSAYLFKRTGTTWAQEAKLLPSDGAASDFFGYSVSISGDYAVVGAEGNDDNGDQSGSAYVFKLTGTSWAEEAKLLASDAAAADEFGFSVSIYGDYAVVGAHFDDDNGSNSGSAYLYTISPVLSLSSDKVDFSTVFIGFPVSKQLIFTNSGVDSLFISDISSESRVFAIDVTSSDLGAGGRDTLTVTFSSTSTGLFSGKLTFASNDFRNSLKTVHLTGNVLVTPVISVTPDSIDEVLVMGDSASQFITIKNGGGSDLIWQGFTIQSGELSVLSSSPNFVGKGEIVKSKTADNLYFDKISRSLIYRSEITADAVVSKSKSSESKEKISFASNDLTLEAVLDSLNLYFENVTAAIPNKFDFTDGVTGNNILDGGDDMYDNGNFISTDLGGPIDYSDDLIIDHTAFGKEGGRYFTRKYPGLFVLAADMNGVSNFDINGDLGPDGDGGVDGAVLSLDHAGIKYYGFVKRVIEWNGDPSVNHLIIVEQLPDVGHVFSTNSDNDFHRVTNLQTTTRLYYLLYAGTDGEFINDDKALRIMYVFLQSLEPFSFSWIRLTPESGIVAAGASSKVEVFLDGRLLSPEDYEADIEIISNDPSSEKNTIPVRFKVLPPPIDPPVITSIEDVPEDQGGWVTVSWNASKDNDFFSDTPVKFYSIWLRDNSAGGASFTTGEVLLKAVNKPVTKELIEINKTQNRGLEKRISYSDGFERETNKALLKKFSSRINERSRIADKETIGRTDENSDGLNNFELPGKLSSFISDGGKWIGIGTIGAIQDRSYAFLVHTLIDSNDTGINWSVLKISAHPENPFTFAFSEVDSGYSVDNLSPAVPSGLLAIITGGDAVQLTWDAPVDADFEYFRIYRSTEPGFDPSGIEPYSESIDTLFIDSEVSIDQTDYYKLSAVDHNGNESGFSEQVSATIVGIEEGAIIPSDYVLYDAFPNPFNPRTTIRYGIPKQSLITLIIYNLRGEEIIRWDEQSAQPGYYEKTWNGTNRFGVPVGSGVYLYRLQSGDFVQTRKMVLLK